MTAHKHAKKMAQYAEDALTTDKPWELWEFRRDCFDWAENHRHPSWHPACEYRRISPALEKVKVAWHKSGDGALFPCVEGTVEQQWCDSNNDYYTRVEIEL